MNKKINMKALKKATGIAGKAVTSGFITPKKPSRREGLAKVRQALQDGSFFEAERAACAKAAADHAGCPAPEDRKYKDLQNAAGSLTLNMLSRVERIQLDLDAAKRDLVQLMRAADLIAK